jgi:hypothetical protein
MNKTSAKRIVLAFLISMTLQSLPAPAVYEGAAKAQTEVALITQLEGNVQLRRGGETRAIRQTMLLNVGDVVKAGDGGRAVIYQAYAPVTRLRPSQSQTIAQLSPPPPQGSIKPEEFARLKRLHLNAKQRREVPSPATMGGQEDAILTLVEPRGSVVLERRPKFVWTSVNEANRYVVTVYDSNEETVWSTSTSGTSVSYPNDLPPLAPGEYKWEVIARVGDRVTGDPALYDATAFTLVSEDSAARINADLAKAQAGDEGAAALLYVSALIEHRRFPQAAAELKRSLESAPQDMALWEMLMETCWQMKLWGTREYARQLSEDSNTSAETVRRLEPRR